MFQRGEQHGGHLSAFHSGGLFDARNPLAALPTAQRVAAYSTIGKAIDPWNPDAVGHLLPR